MININSFKEDDVLLTDRFGIEYIRGLDIRVDGSRPICSPYAVFQRRSEKWIGYVGDFRNAIEAYCYAESITKYYNVKCTAIVVSEGLQNILDIEVAQLNASKP